MHKTLYRVRLSWAFVAAVFSCIYKYSFSPVLSVLEFSLTLTLLQSIAVLLVCLFNLFSRWTFDAFEDVWIERLRYWEA